jgi:DNA invertase Pin-like site-specific DNA recombinase
MRLVRLGKVQVVLCPGLNGLGRSLSHLKRVIGEFVMHKVGLIVPSLGIKSAGDVSVLLAVVDSIEAFKASVAQERINARLAGARQRGVKLGRPTKVNAYRDDVARLRARGLTGRAIAKELSIPSSNVFKLIKGTSL